MDTRTLLLLVVIAVIVGYVVHRDPAIGTAMGIAIAAVGLVALLLKEDDDRKRRDGQDDK
ncbi:hypothetical protein AB0N60_35710 [Streptomyces microflavus]|uniref:hypothetical protein n=1 Tax=Streptomyces microflavus TaxID=1919 RepID=UPI00343589B3